MPKAIKTIKSLLFKPTLQSCIHELVNNEKADSYEMSCGNLILENNEEVQVRIIVIRGKSGFIEPHQIIEHITVSNYR